MISPKIEESRIQFSLRSCREKDLQVFEPIELIKNAVDKFGDSLAVSCSWGRCSVAVLSMVLKVKPDIRIVFEDTTQEFPETYAYRDLILKEWNLNPRQYIETKPVIPFWECWKTYGPPVPRKQYYHGKRRRHTYQEKTGKPACCWFCKDKPFLNFCKENGIEATLRGLRAGESMARMYYFADYGQYHTTKRYGLTNYDPIGFWNRQELISYFERNNISQSEVYTKLGLPRNGCMPCTSYLHWEEFLAKYNPKMLVFIQKLKIQWKQRKDNILDNFLKLEEKAFNNCNQGTTKSRQPILEEWF